MIKNLKIKNFRNIKEAEYNLKELNVLSGRNGLGKSNTLNAIVWFLASSLITDSDDIISATGINSIVPNNYQKGMDTEVSITFENNANYTKKYITTYKRGTDVISGHTTEYYINSVICANEKQFLTDLYKDLNFTEALPQLKVNEVKLFTDPLYALNKLNPNDLRALLVALGCSVSNEELFNDGFEDLKQYEETFKGKFDVMRQNYDKRRLTVLKDIESTEANLKLFANITEFTDNSKEKEEEKAELIKQKTYLTSDTSKATSDVDFKIKSLDLELEYLYSGDKTRFSQMQSTIVAKLKLLGDEKQKDTNNRSVKLKQDMEALNAEFRNLESTKNSYQNQVVLLKNNISNTVAEAKGTIDKKKFASAKLPSVSEMKFSGIVTCPHCNKEFATNPEELAKFEEYKAHQVEELTNNIASYEKRVNELKNTNETNVIDLKKYESELAAIEFKISDNRTKFKALESKLIELQATIDFEYQGKNEELSKELSNLTTSFVKDPKIEDTKAKLEALKTERNQILNATGTELSIKINGIDNQINAITSELADIYAKRSSWLTKSNLLKQLESSRAELNNLESTLVRVNDFIHELISRINDKAVKRTGINFVMLEDQLNGGVKEVCYATIDGTPFATCNTSRKIVEGIKFISKIKELLELEFSIPRNTLPILADRLESIDDASKIKELTKEQFICTRVSKEEKITLGEE